MNRLVLIGNKPLVKNNIPCTHKLKNMKKLFIFFAIVTAVSVMAEEAVDWNKYKYAYVIPTSGVTSQGMTIGLSSAPAKTINPSETISGKLMQQGYCILPNISPELAEKTMIVSYGYTGRQETGLGYASCIIVQFRDAKTHDLLASIETGGNGWDETDDILIAINNVFKCLEYSKAPQVKVNIDMVTKNNLVLYLKNLTPNIINSFTLRLTYLNEDVVVHEQLFTQNYKIIQGDSGKVYITRDKVARNKKLKIKVDVLGYN